VTWETDIATPKLLQQKSNPLYITDIKQTKFIYHEYAFRTVSLRRCIIAGFVNDGGILQNSLIKLQRIGSTAVSHI
jgi:hypothetical protein